MSTPFVKSVGNSSVYFVSVLNYAMTSTTDHHQLYHLDVPATRTTILKLITELIDNHSAETVKTDRVVLQFGTCQLLCRDEREQEEFKNKVTVFEALTVLTETYRCCERV